MEGPIENAFFITPAGAFIYIYIDRYKNGQPGGAYLAPHDKARMPHAWLFDVA